MNDKIVGLFFTSSKNFEFSIRVEKFEAFVSHCNEEDVPIF